MSTTTYVLKHKYEKYQNFLSENFHFFGGKIFSIFEQACFRNVYVKISRECYNHEAQPSRGTKGRRDDKQIRIS